MVARRTSFLQVRRTDWCKLSQEGFKYDDQLLCEQFIPLGRELRRLGAEQPYRSQLGKFMHKSIDCSGDSTIDHSSGLQLVFLRIGVVDGEDDELEFLPVIEYFLGHKPLGR